MSRNTIINFNLPIMSNYFFIIKFIDYINMFFNKISFNCIFFTLSLNLFFKSSDIFLFVKKYIYFFKKRKTFINNFLYMSIAKQRKNINYKKYLSSDTNLLDYKKKIYSVILDNRKLYTNTFLNKSRSNKVTKIIWKTSKLTINQRVSFFNNQLWVVLLKSNFIISQNDIRFILTNRLICLNNNVININIHDKLLLKINDVISLVYNKNYFKYLFYRITKINLFIKKFKKKYLNLSSFYFKNITPLKEFKKNKIKIFKYLFFFRNYNNLNIEIDYFILSIYIISSSLYNSTHNYLLKKLLSIYFYKTYNWKVIN